MIFDFSGHGWIKLDEAGPGQPGLHVPDLSRISLGPQQARFCCDRARRPALQKTARLRRVFSWEKR